MRELRERIEELFQTERLRVNGGASIRAAAKGIIDAYERDLVVRALEDLK